MYSSVSFFVQCHLSARHEPSQMPDMVIREPLHPSRNLLHVSIGFNVLQYVRHRRANPLRRRCCSLRTAPSCPVSSPLAPTHTHYAVLPSSYSDSPNHPYIRHAKLISKPLYKPLTLCSFESHTTQASIELSTLFSSSWVHDTS
jgi:hypothetical protein